MDKQPNFIATKVRWDFDPRNYDEHPQKCVKAFHELCLENYGTNSIWNYKIGKVTNNASLYYFETTLYVFKGIDTSNIPFTVKEFYP